MPTSTSKPPPFIVVSGASGSGKTTICREIAKIFNLYYSVSHTTRAKRPSETHAVDYFFVSVAEFQEMVARGDFFEWARVYDNYYGTSKRIVEQKLAHGQGVILDLDSQGAEQIRQLFPSAKLIFIDTPSIDDLKTRLSQRATDSAGEIAKRVAHAEHEIAQKRQYDFVVMNDHLPRAVEQVQTIVKTLL